MRFTAEAGAGRVGLELGQSPTGHIVLATDPIRSTLPRARRGDVLLAVGGVEVAKKSLSQVVATLKAQPRPLELKFARPSTEEERLLFYGSAELPGVDTQGASNWHVATVGCVLCALCSLLFGRAYGRKSTFNRSFAYLQPDQLAEARGRIVAQQPFLVVGGASAWPAVARWRNSTYLEHALRNSLLGPVYVKPKSTPANFWWIDQSRPLQDWLPAEHQHEVEHIEMRELLRRIRARDEHIKCSSLFSDQAFDPIRGDVRGGGQEGLALHSNGHQQNSTSVLWIGGASAFQAHYDTSQNNFVQIVGEKVVTLSPPQAWRRLKPFPHLHPAFGGSQLDGSDGSDGSDRHNDNDGDLEVRVREGDALYIPPWWWHRVECVTPLCISLSTWSRTQEYSVFSAATKVHARQLEKLQQLGLLQQQAGRVRAALSTSLRLLERLHAHDRERLGVGVGVGVGVGSFEPRRFVREAFVESRYKSWVDRSGQQRRQQRAPLGCSTSEGTEAGAAVAECERIGAQIGGRQSSTSEKPAEAEAPEVHADELAALFERIPSRGARELVVADFLEHVAHQAVRPAAGGACGFLAGCLPAGAAGRELGAG